MTELLLTNCSFNQSEEKPFGDCHHDYVTMALLLIAMVAMVFGNGLLLYVGAKTFASTRTDTVVLNQAVVDVAYCILFPFVILDASRMLRSHESFVAFKIFEDSLLTLSVLAVLLVNVHKYLSIHSTYVYMTTVSSKATRAAIALAWALTPLGLTIRNLHFTCRRNKPCGSSYFYCLAASGRGEISSILFYISAALVIIGLNVKLLAMALRFQTNDLRVRRSSTLSLGRKNFSRPLAERRQRYMKILLYPLLSSLLLLVTISPFWIAMAACQMRVKCFDFEHSLFYLMRLHSMFNPYCTLMTHRKYRKQVTLTLFGCRKEVASNNSALQHSRDVHVSHNHDNVGCQQKRQDSNGSLVRMQSCLSVRCSTLQKLDIIVD